MTINEWVREAAKKNLNGRAIKAFPPPPPPNLMAVGTLFCLKTADFDNLFSPYNFWTERAIFLPNIATNQLKDYDFANIGTIDILIYRVK